MTAFKKKPNVRYAIDNNMYYYCFEMHTSIQEILVHQLTPSNGDTQHCYLSGVRLDLSSPMYISRHCPIRIPPEAGSLPAIRRKRDSVAKDLSVLSIMVHAAV